MSKSWKCTVCGEEMRFTELGWLCLNCGKVEFSTDKLNAKLHSDEFELVAGLDAYTNDIDATLYCGNGVYATGRGKTVNIALENLEAALIKGECGPEADGLVEPRPNCEHEWSCFDESTQLWECQTCRVQMDDSEYALRGAE